MGKLEWDWDHTEHLGTSFLPLGTWLLMCPPCHRSGKLVQAGRFALAIATMGVEELGGGGSRHGDEGDYATLSVFRGGTGADNHSSGHQHTQKARRLESTTASWVHSNGTVG